jgi:hypothetical protein
MAEAKKGDLFESDDALNESLRGIREGKTGLAQQIAEEKLRAAARRSKQATEKLIDSAIAGNDAVARVWAEVREQEANAVARGDTYKAYLAQRPEEWGLRWVLWVIALSWVLPCVFLEYFFTQIGWIHDTEAKARYHAAKRRLISDNKRRFTAERLAMQYKHNEDHRKHRNNLFAGKWNQKEYLAARKKMKEDEKQLKLRHWKQSQEAEKRLKKLYEECLAKEQEELRALDKRAAELEAEAKLRKENEFADFQEFKSKHVPWFMPPGHPDRKLE